MGFNLLSSIGHATKSVGHSISSGTKKLGDTITKPFKDIGHGISKGVKDTAKWLKGAGDTVLGAASYTGKSLLGDLSSLTSPTVLIAIAVVVVVVLIKK